MRISSAIDESLRYIAYHQNDTGGIAEQGADGSSDGTTAWSVFAFAAAGYDPAMVKLSGGQSLSDYVKNKACTYSTATDIERTILALAAADINLGDITGCDLKAKLDALKAPSGRIGPDVISTVFGALAYSATNEPIDQTTIDYIVSQQQPDDGWSSGWGTEANITAQAIMALSSAGYDKSSPAIINAKQYLKNLQTDSGGIKYDANAWTTTPDAFSDAYSLQAISALGEKPGDSFWRNGDKSILDDVTTLKKADGSYRFSLDPDYGDLTPVWTTSVVIPALEGKPLGWRGTNLLPFSTTDPVQAQPVVIVPKTDTPVESTTVEKNDNNILPAPVASTDTTDSIASSPASILADNTTSDSSDNANGMVMPQKIDDPSTPTASHDLPVTNHTIVFWLLLAGAGLVLGVGASVLLGRYKLILPIIVLAAVLIPAVTYASRAGVVVRHSDGSTKQKCVEFNESSVTGYDLLQRGGLNPILDRGFIVSIDNDHAKSFSDPGSQNDYWSYWQLKNGSWLYARAGATASTAKDGNVDGWQRGGSGLMLSPISFDTICPPIPAVKTTQQSPAAAASSNSSIASSAATQTSALPPNQTSDQKAAPPPTNVVGKDGTIVASAPAPSPATSPSNQNTNQNTNIVQYLIIILAAIVLGFIAHRLLTVFRRQKNKSVKKISRAKGRSNRHPPKLKPYSATASGGGSGEHGQERKIKWKY